MLTTILNECPRHRLNQEHGDETSRKTNLDTYLEDATRLLDGLMNTLHQHTSALIDEAAVNDALSRKHQDFIIQNIANMVKDTVDGRDAEMFFIGICNMAVCQWKIQREALMSLSPQRGSSSMYYNNSGDDLPHQGQSSTPSHEVTGRTTGQVIRNDSRSTDKVNGNDDDNVKSDDRQQLTTTGDSTIQ